ncbi:MAG: restriction endonuclease [Dehalococcoidia bacterium]|nr:restriction endonuclease [Dehalococcoidia bacterium]
MGTTPKKTKRSTESESELLKVHEKKVQGLKANIKGGKYEQKVANEFTKKGWKIEMHKRVKGYDIDVYGKKTTGGDWLEDDFTEHLLVECKDKDMVTKADVMNFEKTLVAFGKTKHVTAIVAYTSRIDKGAQEAVKGFSPRIQLKHTPL